MVIVEAIDPGFRGLLRMVLRGEDWVGLGLNGGHEMRTVRHLTESGDVPEAGETFVGLEGCWSNSGTVAIVGEVVVSKFHCLLSETTIHLGLAWITSKLKRQAHIVIAKALQRSHSHICGVRRQELIALANTPQRIKLSCVVDFLYFVQDSVTLGEVVSISSWQQHSI